MKLNNNFLSLLLMSIFVIPLACGTPDNVQPFNQATSSIKSIDATTKLTRIEKESTLLAEIETNNVNSGVSLDNTSIHWNEDNTLRLLWGPNVAISSLKYDCQGETEQIIHCVVANLEAYLGDSVGSNIVFNRVTTLDNGFNVYRYKQVYGNTVVYGADLAVTADTNNNIVRIYSTLVSNLQVVVSEAGTEDTYKNYSINIDDLSNELGTHDVAIVDEQPLILPSRNENANIGHVVLKTHVILDGVKDVFAYIDIINANIIKIEDVTREYAAQQVTKTYVTFEDWSSSSCRWPPTGCPPDWTCSDHMDGEKCVTYCANSGDCPLNWICWDNPKYEFFGYCARGLSFFAAGALTLYDGAWADTDYSYHKRFSDYISIVENLLDFFYLELQRDSWDDNDGDPITYLHACCPNDAGECNTIGDGCEAMASTDGYVVNFYSWWNLAQEEFGRKVSIRHVTAHEFGHTIVHDEAGGWLSKSECMDESLAEIYGSLFSVKEMGDSSHRYTVDCGEEEDIGTSPWRTYDSGLSPGCSPVHLPYAHRSRFDWLACDGVTWGASCSDDDDCQPYEGCIPNGSGEYQCSNKADDHNNGQVWQRFARVLSEGSDTFDEDDQNEDVGVEITGIGRINTSRIVHDATTNLSTSSKLSDWNNLLLSAAYYRGYYSETQKALGVAGFISYVTAPASDTTDSAPNRYYFSSWNQSANKYFYAYRKGYDIIVRYYNSQGQTSDTITANTDIAPAMVEYNNRLYIFWRDRSTHEVKLTYYRYDGVDYGPYSMSTLGVYVSGGFDAVVYNSSLYIVFPYDVSYGWMFVAKCTSAFCNTSGWHDYTGSGYYKKYIGWSAYGGVGADVASGLNGTGFQTAIYVASSQKSGGNDKRIRIDMVDTNDYTQHHEWMPTNYPSYTTTDQIGVKAVSAAFPSATTYLYLGWKDYSDDKLYKSVVQNFDDDGGEGTWLTRSVEILVGESDYGLRIQKGGSYYVDGVSYVFANSSDQIRYAKQFGRY